jgi:hypothetical protein
METHGCVVGVYESEEAAQAALEELQRAGFSVKQVSMVGKVNKTEENFPLAGGEIRAAGKQELQSQDAPQIKAAAATSGSSILIAGLHSVGVLKENAQRYEEAVSAGKFLVVAEGSSPDVVKAKQVLHLTPHAEIAQHTSAAKACGG